MITLRTRRLAGLAGVILAIVAPVPAGAQSAPGPNAFPRHAPLPDAPAPDVRAPDARPERILIDYGEPTNPEHRRAVDGLRSRRALETVRAILAPLRLPRPLLVRTAGCDGEPNAWFENDVVTICYEYVAWIAAVARKPSRPAWVSEEAALTGPFLEVALHEAAHALFAQLDVPILGREEDAADQLAALWILTLAPERAGELVAGIAATYLDEAGYRTLRALSRPRLRIGRATAQADEHSTPIQRLYNLLCLAHGSDPVRFKAIADAGALPAERAEGCKGEHAQVVHAFERLVRPHVDPEVAARVYGPGGPLGRPSTRP